jgi:hypothetical protein
VRDVGWTRGVGWIGRVGWAVKTEGLGVVPPPKASK